MFTQTHKPAYPSFPVRNILWQALSEYYFSPPRSPTNRLNIPLMTEPNTPPNEINYQTTFFRRYGKHQKAFQMDVTRLDTVSSALKKDEYTILRAITDGYALQYAPDFQDDEEVALKAVQKTADALLFVSARLKARRIVFTAINQNPEMLKLASDNLKNDTKLVLSAVNQNPYALLHASEQLQANKNLILFAIGLDGNVLQCVAPALQNNKDVVTAAVT
jgi:hypothetical protein